MDSNITKESIPITTYIAFNKLNGIIIPNDEKIHKDNLENTLLIAFTHELLNYGYIITDDLYNSLNDLDEKISIQLYNEILFLAKESVGAHVKHEVFYPNFPQQVIEASDLELILNALIHYWSFGALRPLYEKIPRVAYNEDHPPTSVSIITIDKVKEYFFKLIGSKSSIPESLLPFLDHGIEIGWINEYEGKIPFRETICRIAANMVKKNQKIDSIVTVTTDILRIMAFLSDQDIELKAKIKFKSLPRKQRRILCSTLEKIISIEDVKRHATLWKRAFHCLHVGEYGGKLYTIATKFRNTNNVETVDTIIGEAIKSKEIRTAVDKLVYKPSVLLRTLDKLIRDCKDEEDFEYIFSKTTQIINSVDSKILLQLLGHFQGRIDDTITTRVVVTAGSKGLILHAPLLERLSTEKTNKIIDEIKSALISNYKSKELLINKTIFISPEVEKVLLPLQLASSSNTKNTVSRGSHVPFIKTEDDNDKSIIRLFVHWIGYDIDLSAYFINSDLTSSSMIAFTNLKEPYAVHSGDITRAPAPNGASEFIDIDINKALKGGHRYVAMDLRVFSGPSFNSHERCFAGFMLRKEMQSGEIFEPSSVRIKFDVVSDSRTVCPCLFDLETREIIWLDAPIHLNSINQTRPNALSANAAPLKQIIKAYIESYKSKITIPQLIQLHAQSIGAVITTTKSESNFKVGLDPDDDLSVYDFTTINSTWI